MDCAAVKPRMEALVSGSLPEPERSLAEQHIAMCEGCRLELELVRAIGSQEKPPAAAKDDWTLDRIFGAEGPSAEGPSPQPAPASGSSPKSEDSSDASAVFPGSEPPPSPPSGEADKTTPDEEEPAAESGPPRKVALEASWDFEPADAKAHVKPPEESLFFATEALGKRQGAGPRKGSGARIILWGAGGLIGLALLVFSAWLVVNMGSSTPQVPATIVPAPAPGTSGGDTEGTPEATPAPSDVHQDGSGVPTPTSTPQPPDNSAQTAPPPPAPRATASSIAPQPLPLPAPRTTTGPKNPGITSRTGSAQEHHVGAPSQGASPRITRVIDPTGLTESRGPISGPPAPVSDDEPIESDDEAPSTDSTAPQATRTPPSSGRGSAIWSSTAPRPEEPPAEAPVVDPNSPVEKLHQETIQAAENGDMVALRRLRTTWKTFLAKTVGPDRSRAKREYADCLWAIQSNTGRKADQKEALAAYRDYLLSAPAGGADSRSASRLRQLEDALTEHR